MIKCFGVFLLFCSCSSLGADIYKWVDENGQVHYGDNPPLELKTESNYIGPIGKGGVKKATVAAQVTTNEDINRYVIDTPGVPGRYNWSLWLTHFGGELYINLEGKVVRFNIQSGESEIYEFKRYLKTRGLSASNMAIIADGFVFLGEDKASGLGAFHIFNVATGLFRVLLMQDRYRRVMTVDNQYSNDLFFLLNRRSIAQLSSQNNGDRLIESNRILIENRFTVDYVSQLAVNERTIWYQYGRKNPCSIGSYEKATGVKSQYGWRDIGLAKNAECGWLVADSREVWLGSSIKKALRPESSLSIYDIKKGEWSTMRKSANGKLLSSGALQMDNNYIYYTSCAKLFALDRSTKYAHEFYLGPYDGNAKGDYCIKDLKILEDDAWLLTYEKIGYRAYPVLYQVPRSRLISGE